MLANEEMVLLAAHLAAMPAQLPSSRLAGLTKVAQPQPGHSRLTAERSRLVQTQAPTVTVGRHGQL